MRIRSGKKTGLNRKIRPAASSSQLPWAWWWDTTGSRTGWDLDFGHIPAFFFKTPRASLRRCFFLPIFSVLDFQLFQFLQWFPWCFLFFSPFDPWFSHGASPMCFLPRVSLLADSSESPPRFRTFASNRRCKTFFCRDCTKAGGAWSLLIVGRFSGRGTTGKLVMF